LGVTSVKNLANTCYLHCIDDVEKYDKFVDGSGPDQPALNMKLKFYENKSLRLFHVLLKLTISAFVDLRHFHYRRLSLELIIES